jgi:hypothetical protein
MTVFCIRTNEAAAGSWQPAAAPPAPDTLPYTDEVLAAMEETLAAIALTAAGSTEIEPPPLPTSIGPD